MPGGIQFALYLVAAVILGGIAFLGWSLLQLVHEKRRLHHEVEPASYQTRWRYRMHVRH
jgi:hypothetical protein